MLRFPRSIGAHRHAAMLAEMIRSDILRHHNGVSRGYSVPDSNDDIQRPWGKHKSWKLARKTQWK